MNVKPQSARTWAKVADYHYQNMQLITSIESLNKGFELAPWEAGFLLAKLSLACNNPTLLKKKEIIPLIENTIQAINLKPNTAYTNSQLINLTRLCNKKNQTLQFEPIYVAASQQPNAKMASRGYYMLAMTHLHKGEKSNAKGLLKKVLKLDPNSQQVKEMLLQL